MMPTRGRTPLKALCRPDAPITYKRVDAVTGYVQQHTHWAVLLAGLVLLTGCTGTGGSTDGTGDDGAGDGETVLNGTVTVDVTDAGFEPATITVEQGTTVTWVNQRDSATWPASNVHPTHQQYPGGDYAQSGSYFGSQACTGENQAKDGAFDPCHHIQPGETFSFTFNHTGTWGYHDHLRPSTTGTVRVVE